MFEKGGAALTLVLLCGLRICVPSQAGQGSRAPENAVPQAGAPAPNAKAKKLVIYTNDSYGFKFELPESWKGYTVIAGKWQGNRLDGQDAAGKPKSEGGPLLTIRHPRWTEARPYQDIPIMVFTLEQWKLIDQEQLAVSAAPIGPSELGRNGKYVFALPARYNFGDAEGIEEVNDIMAEHPLHAY